VRRLYCRKCGYDLTPLFQGEVFEAVCPECGSPADKRRANAKSTWWWRKPALLSIGAGTIPALFGLATASVLLPLSIPAGAAICLVVALFVFPRDVPGRANFGRFCPFLFMVCIASFAVNFVLVAVISFATMLLSIP